MSNETQTQMQNDKPGAREWVRPAVKEAGNVADILQGGGGKLSLEAADTGDSRKNKNHG